MKHIWYEADLNHPDIFIKKTNLVVSKTALCFLVFALTVAIISAKCVNRADEYNDDYEVAPQADTKLSLFGLLEGLEELQKGYVMGKRGKKKGKGRGLKAMGSCYTPNGLFCKVCNLKKNANDMSRYLVCGDIIMKAALFCLITVTVVIISAKLNQADEFEEQREDINEFNEELQETIASSEPETEQQKHGRCIRPDDGLLCLCNFKIKDEKNPARYFLCGKLPVDPTLKPEIMHDQEED